MSSKIHSERKEARENSMTEKPQRERRPSRNSLTDKRSSSEKRSDGTKSPNRTPRDSSGKSPRQPNSGRRGSGASLVSDLSQSSGKWVDNDDSITPRRSMLSRQSSAKGDSDYDITDFSPKTTASKKSRRKEVSPRPRRRRVSFSNPIIDPRPEPQVGSGSVPFDDREYDGEYKLWKSENDDGDVDITPRRMKNRKRYKGRWRRYIPFGQYIPRLPNIFCGS
mmetsp:Transcript_3798/g.5936  ORF Transcript_3798/g.5936 Transcript_3798/m.5936 type:complete len:222 (-) Transcript_3798:1002-1667(-)